MESRKSSNFPLLLAALGSLIADLDELEPDWTDEYGGCYSGPGDLVGALEFLPGAQIALIDDDRRLDWRVRIEAAEDLPSLGQLSESDRKALCNLLIEEVASLQSGDPDRGPLVLILQVVADDPWGCADGAASVAQIWLQNAGAPLAEFYGLS